MTANEDYFDGQIRKQIALRMFSDGEARQLTTLLNTARNELNEFLRNSDPSDFQKSRVGRLLTEIRLTRRALFNDIRDETISNLERMARVDVRGEIALLNGTLPFAINFATPSPEVLSSIVRNNLFLGKTTSDWFRNIESRDSERIRDAINLGITQGETRQQITRRVIGTRANRYADGVVDISRRNAEAIVRSAINFTTNSARDQFYKDNSRYISVLRWTATLDGRTSTICRAYDGAFTTPDGSRLPSQYRANALRPQGARPPAHVNCRSVMIAIVNGAEIVGERTTVVETIDGQARRYSFRAEARRRGISEARLRRDYVQREIGALPATADYDSFLRRQTVEFQDSILGVRKGQLFREGLSLRQFVNETGRTLRIAELEALL